MASTDAELTAEFSTAPRVVAQIRRGSTRLARRLRFERPADSLSLTKIAVLAHVYRAGAATPGEIAAAERLQPQSLTRVLAELEADGLITRERDERDRRQSVLELTEAGGFALAADMGARDRWLAEALEELTETERQVLYLAGALMDRISGLGRPGPADRPEAAGRPGSADQERGMADQRGPEGEHAGLGEEHGEQAQ
ncbi:MAG TPA: MarR family transcriptional regulator [Actinospica sp.]|nr:MarR family transcriptional regulator [Actinospica sp.]